MNTRLVFFLCLMLLPGQAFSGQEIYKIVDEEGNVTFTDQRPDELASPMDLPELNVMESPPAIGEASSGTALAGSAGERERLRFRIVEPAHEEHILGTGQSLNATVGSNIALPDTALVVFFIDGEAQPPVSGTSAQFEGIDRGEHTLRAELQTPSGRVLARTETITFFMRQASRLHPPPP